MRYFNQILLFGSILLIFNACSVIECGGSSEDLVDNFTNFVDNVGDLRLDYESKQWAIHDKRFEHFLEDCYEHHEVDMTGRERRRFWGKVLKYVKLRYGTSVIRQLFTKEDSMSIENFFKDGALDDLKKKLKTTPN